MNKFILILGLITWLSASLICTLHLFMSSVLMLDGWVFWESNVYILYPELFFGFCSVYILGRMILEVIDEY